jgi:hypothetical protein
MRNPCAQGGEADRASDDNMSIPSGAPISDLQPPLSFKEFEDLIRNSEGFYSVGSRLSQTIEKQPCEYLIQEASMAFTKALMSLLGFLRFIPSSRFHAKEGESIIDLSSAAAMARQVIEDVLSFIYLTEPDLSKEQKAFREFVWRSHGLGESIKSAELLETLEWSNPDLPATRDFREKIRARLI